MPDLSQADMLKTIYGTGSIKGCSICGTLSARPFRKISAKNDTWVCNQCDKQHYFRRPVCGNCTHVINDSNVVRYIAGASFARILHKDSIPYLDYEVSSSDYLHLMNPMLYCSTCMPSTAKYIYQAYVLELRTTTENSKAIRAQIDVKGCKNCGTNIVSSIETLPHIMDDETCFYCNPTAYKELYDKVDEHFHARDGFSSYEMRIQYPKEVIYLNNTRYDDDDDDD